MSFYRNLIIATGITLLTLVLEPTYAQPIPTPNPKPTVSAGAPRPNISKEYEVDMEDLEKRMEEHSVEGKSLTMMRFQETMELATVIAKTFGRKAESKPDTQVQKVDFKDYVPLEELTEEEISNYSVQKESEGREYIIFQGPIVPENLEITFHGAKLDISNFDKEELHAKYGIDTLAGKILIELDGHLKDSYVLIPKNIPGKERKSGFIIIEKGTDNWAVFDYGSNTSIYAEDKKAAVSLFNVVDSLVLK